MREIERTRSRRRVGKKEERRGEVQTESKYGCVSLVNALLVVVEVLVLLLFVRSKHLRKEVQLVILNML